MPQPSGLKYKTTPPIPERTTDEVGISPEDTMQTFQVNSALDKVTGRLMFSPDGRYLSIEATPHVMLDTRGGPTKSFRQRGKSAVGYEWGHCFVVGGKACAYLSESLKIVVANLKGGKEKKLKPTGFRPRNLAVGPDGKTLFVLGWPEGPGNKAEIREFAVASLKLKSTFGFRKGGYTGKFEASADGLQLADADNTTSKTKIRIWDVSGENAPDKPTAIIKPGSPYNRLSLSADGSRLAIVSKSGLSLWDTSTGKRVFSSDKHDCTVTAVACDPTRELIATGDKDGLVFLWDHAGKILTRFDWKLAGIYALTFAPDGLRCAAVDKKGKVVIWDVDM